MLKEPEGDNLSRPLPARQERRACQIVVNYKLLPLIAPFWIAFLSFSLIPREEVKAVQRTIAALPRRYRCRFESPDDLAQFLTLNPGLAVEREGNILVITRRADEPSLMRLFDTFDRPFHLVKLAPI